MSCKTWNPISVNIKPWVDTTIRKLHLVALIQNLKMVTYVPKGIFLSGKERREKGREGSQQAGREGGQS